MTGARCTPMWTGSRSARGRRVRRFTLPGISVRSPPRQRASFISGDRTTRAARPHTRKLGSHLEGDTAPLRSSLAPRPFLLFPTRGHFIGRPPRRWSARAWRGRRKSLLSARVGNDHGASHCSPPTGRRKPRATRCGALRRVRRSDRTTGERPGLALLFGVSAACSVSISAPRLPHVGPEARACSRAR